MEIKYNVQAPPKKSFNGGSKSAEVQAITDFLSCKAKNMAFDYETVKEAKSKMSTIQSHRRKHDLTKIIDAYRVDKTIYIVRVGGKK